MIRAPSPASNGMYWRTEWHLPSPAPDEAAVCIAQILAVPKRLLNPLSVIQTLLNVRRASINLPPFLKLTLP